MPTLARQLRATDYFTLGWGTMVGVGWLVVMDDWLSRGGAVGALLGFVIGGALLFPIGWVYGKLVVAMPDAAGEIAYTSAVFPGTISFATGWMMSLAYFIVCPWEAVAVGRIAGYIFPALDTIEIYQIAGRPVNRKLRPYGGRGEPLAGVGKAGPTMGLTVVVTPIQ